MSVCMHTTSTRVLASTLVSMHRAVYFTVLLSILARVATLVVEYYSMHIFIYMIIIHSMHTSSRTPTLVLEW